MKADALASRTGSTASDALEYLLEEIRSGVWGGWSPSGDIRCSYSGWRWVASVPMRREVSL